VNDAAQPDSSAWEVLRAIPSPLALTDRSGMFLAVNQQLCAAVGRGEAALLQAGIDDILHPPDVAEDSRQLRRLLDGETDSYQTRQHLRRPGGATTPVRCLVWLAGPGREKAGSQLNVVRLFHSIGPGDAGSARHAAAIVASSGDAITGYSLDGRITHWNPAAERLYQIRADEAVGRLVSDVLPVEWAADKTAMLARVARRERIENYETIRRRPDGTGVEVALSIAPIMDDCDRVAGASVVARDISQRKRAESLLSGQAGVLEMIAAGASLHETLDALAELIESQTTRVRCSIVLTEEGPTKRLRHGGGLRLPGVENTPADEMFTDAPGGPSGRAAVMAGDLMTDPRWTACRDAVLGLGLRSCWSSPIVTGGDGMVGAFMLYGDEKHRPDGDAWDLLDRLAQVAALAIGRHCAHEELARQAIHDPLTGAANRTLVVDRLGHALQRLARDRTKAAVLFLDLDRFKALNDRYGHEAGDSVLVDLTQRLHSVVRPSDTVARLGGDEFVVLCDPILGELEAVGIADRIAQAVGCAFLVEDNEVQLTASIGIAFLREGDTPESVLGHADAAMYQAKERGKARFQVFDDAMHEEAIARLHIEQSLRQALHAEQFTLVYQPLVELAGERCIGVEALLRWDHPQRGLLAPGEFLSVAEESGLIVPMGEWVLFEACRQLARWCSGEPTRDVTVHVNVSARQLTPQLPRMVSAALSAAGADASRLCLEITETVLMADAPLALQVLHSLKSLGLRLSIDDFGTGYSSLSYVNSLPVDELKIDRSFIGDIRRDAEATIVRAVVGLSHALGLYVVAEGVETVDQLEQLREMGCDVGQGFFWSRPVIAADVEGVMVSVSRGRPRARAQG
jgi:diguanylate cyclase (GGDEF)-like protein/PAS domain S-box-containing protein